MLLCWCHRVMLSSFLLLLYRLMIGQGGVDCNQTDLCDDVIMMSWWPKSLCTCIHPYKFLWIAKTSVICEAYMYHFVLFSTLVINNLKCPTLKCDIYKLFNLHVYGNNKIILHLHVSLICILEDHYFDF